MWIPAGDIDAAKSVGEIIDIESQRLFDMQHHYCSKDHGRNPPTEGEAFVNTSRYDVLKRLGEIPICAAIVKTFNLGFPTAKEGQLAVYGLRAGNVPYEYDYGIERTVHPVVRDVTERVAEAGIGFFRTKYYWGDARKFLGESKRIVLRIIGEDAESEPTLRVYNPFKITDGKADQPKDLPIDDDSAKEFLQIYRDAVWESVSEPA